MNICTKKMSVNLEDMDDGQFSEFLGHAPACRSCDERLMKFENSFIPVLREALADEIAFPFGVPPVTTRRLMERLKSTAWSWNPATFFGGSISTGLWRILGTAVVLVPPAVAFGYMLGTFVTQTYRTPLSEADIQAMDGFVKVRGSLPSREATTANFENFNPPTSHLEGVQSVILAAPTTRPKADKKHFNTSVQRMEFAGDDLEALASELPDGLDSPRDNSIVQPPAKTSGSNSIVRVQLIGDLPASKELNCVLRENFGGALLDTVYHPIKGICSVPISSSNDFEIVIEAKTKEFIQTLPSAEIAEGKRNFIVNVVKAQNDVGAIKPK